MIRDDLDETLTMWTDTEATKYFANTCWLLVLRTVKNSSESEKLLVNERDSKCYEAVVGDSDVHTADDTDNRCNITQVRITIYCRDTRLILHRYE